MINEGKKVLMIAGDTFRAGAYEQLKEWADKTVVYLLVIKKVMILPVLFMMD
jgi:fused signal recognition particle receptor